METNWNQSIIEYSMDELFNIFLRLVTNGGSVNIAVSFSILLLFFVMIATVGRRRQTAQKNDVLVKSPENMGTIIDEKKSNVLKSPSPAVPDKLDKPAALPDLHSQTILDNNIPSSLEITRELDLSDSPDRLAPEHAFSIEIKENKDDVDPSVIAPKFAVEPVQTHTVTAELSKDSAAVIAEDRISIPRLGDEDNSSDFFASNEKLILNEQEGPAEFQADEVKKPRALTKTLPHDQNESKTKAIPFYSIEPDLRVVTPDEIADAVASLVSGDQREHSITTSAEAMEEATSNGKVESQPAFAKERDMGEGVIEEIEHLAEVEGKMRALRELFEAGLIAPEVYLLKAREYASKGL